MNSSQYSLADGFIRRHRVIEPDPEIDESLRNLGRQFAEPDFKILVLPRVSEAAEIQVLLDTLVPYPGVRYQTSRDVAHQLHSAIDNDDEEAVFRILFERADPNISLPGSMLSPLHRAFDQRNLIISAFLAVAGADIDEPDNDGQTALMRGIQCDFAGQFTALLLHLGARIDAVDNNGCTATHHATMSNVVDNESLDVLIKAGADLNLTDYIGRTPLHMAIQSGHPNAATKLIKANVELETRLPDGKTALHLAIAARNQELSQILISRGANVNCVLREQTPLTMAINGRCTAITAILIDGGADPNLGSRSGNTPLLSAAATGHEETVRYLLAHGADASTSESQNGYTALHMAAHKNRPYIIRLLAESGAPVDALDQSGETPLLVAARLGNVESALRLIEDGADIDITSPDETTVLSHSVKHGNLHLVETLMDKGAGLEMMKTPTCGNGDVQRELPATPLHIAAQHGHDAILMRLVAGGARLESTVYPGRTPLYVAAANGHLSTVQLLLRLGANAHARTAHRDTVLFDASGNVAVLKLLIQRGIDVNRVNDHGATALHYAALRGHLAGVKLLLDKGAKQVVANAVWEGWDRRAIGSEYRQGTPAGIAKQKGFDKVADVINKSKC